MKNATDKSKRDKQREVMAVYTGAAICIGQEVAMATWGGSQQSETLPKTPMWVAEHWVLGPSSTSFPGKISENWIVSRAARIETGAQIAFPTGVSQALEGLSLSLSPLPISFLVCNSWDHLDNESSDGRPLCTKLEDLYV